MIGSFDFYLFLMYLLYLLYILFKLKIDIKLGEIFYRFMIEISFLKY